MRMRFKRKCFSKIFIFILAAMLVGIYFKKKDHFNSQHLISCTVDYTKNSNWNSSLRIALECRSSQNKTIILALVDLGTYEMTINFYETSILRHGIQSYLFLSTSAKMCELLNARGIACLSYGSDAASDKRSMFGTKEFIRKMNLRTYLILDVLRLGYNVLHTDVDVIFIRNPLLDLSCPSELCDVAIMWDIDAYNAGFLLIRSTNSSIEMYNEMRITAETTDRTDQEALNLALKKLKGRLKVLKLSIEKYPCGKYFYEDTGRHFGDDPSLKHTPAVVIHNNWIISVEAKTYRFKEMLQWNYDENGYYSSETAKYISYENPLFNSQDTISWNTEGAALKNAILIGALLNRTVILPKFHCGKKHCSLLNWLKVRHFDEVFKDKYRESTFLSHFKVPESIRASVSSKFLIKNKRYVVSISPSDDVIEHLPSDEVNGPSISEILKWYGSVDKSVLRFKCLYGEFKQLRNLQIGSYNLSGKAFEAAFVTGSYIQH